MTVERPASDDAYLNRALDASIHIGLAVLLTAACLFILLPFIPLITWGIIIAVAAFPSFKKLQGALGGRAALSAVLFTLAFLAVLMIPCYLLAQSLIQGVQVLTAHIKDGSLTIPPPPDSVATWPIIGAQLSRVWAKASTNLTDVLMQFTPQIKSAFPAVLSATAGVGFTLLQFILSIVVAGAILAKAQAAYEVVRSLMNRLFGEKGPEYQQLIGSTIRSVTSGILGVAFI